MNEKNRYIRQLGIIGEDGQIALKQSKILCVGVGGLGVIASGYLVGAGIGEISLIDNDNIELSNLTRQITYNESDCSKSKVNIHAEFLRKLNSSCKISAYNTFLNLSNSHELIALHDLVIDCSDNFETRYLISDVCHELNKPLISASIDGFTGQVITLLYNICYRCVFPENKNQLTSCYNGNVIGPAVGIIASIQANEVLKYLTNINNKNYIIQLDSLNNKLTTFNLNVNLKCINDHSEEIYSSTNSAKQYSLNEVLNLYNQKSIKIIDISNTLKNIYDIDSIQINNNNILNSILNSVDKDTKVAIVCNFGYKSKVIASQLISLGYKNVYFSSILFLP